jgi:hypothetical protein
VKDKICSKKLSQFNKLRDKKYHLLQQINAETPDGPQEQLVSKRFSEQNCLPRLAYLLVHLLKKFK